MSLISLSEILTIAENNNTAIGAFNIGNYESCRAVMHAAVELKMPVIVQLFHRLFNDSKACELAYLVRGMAESADIPVVLHLDHGKTVEHVEKAIKYGFTSVMIDGSELPFKENVAITKEVVALARSSNVSVEAELGHVLPKDADNKEIYLTMPEEANDFVKETAVDALAVAIGTAHGHYRQTPKLDLERLKKIRSLVSVPLVLHGGSDTPIEDVQKSISLGIRKINIATELVQIYLDEMANQVSLHKNEFIPLDVYMQPVYEKMKELVKLKMNQFAFKN
jgi:fructose-bisphosphate aldolase class II